MHFLKDTRLCLDYYLSHMKRERNLFLSLLYKNADY